MSRALFLFLSLLPVAAATRFSVLTRMPWAWADPLPMKVPVGDTIRVVCNLPDRTHDVRVWFARPREEFASGSLLHDDDRICGSGPVTDRNARYRNRRGECVVSAGEQGACCLHGEMAAYVLHPANSTSFTLELKYALPSDSGVYLCTGYQWGAFAGYAVTVE